MPIRTGQAVVATAGTRLLRSRVGASLRRLHETLDGSRQLEHQLADRFASWQEKWSTRRDQIAQRLTVIDTQLEQLVQNHLRRPQLSVVTSAEEHGIEGFASLEAY